MAVRGAGGQRSRMPTKMSRPATTTTRGRRRWSSGPNHVKGRARRRSDDMVETRAGAQDEWVIFDLGRRSSLMNLKVLPVPVVAAMAACLIGVGGVTAYAGSP